MVEELKRVAIRIVVLLTALELLASSAMAAGTIPLSMTQQFDSSGRPLNGGRLYFYAAGTTTPQSAYQDSALTIPHPNPITLDSAGRVPQVFLADGWIKIRLTSSAGVTQISADNVLVIGPSSGGGGGVSVDPTTIFQTGAFMQFYGTGVLTGWVRCNGRTIGSASSGASERANADTQALFEYLWTADANLTVSTGRGVSANADWVANKKIALPDCRGRVVAGLDDMGNSAAGRLTATYLGATATVLGAAGGTESRTLGTLNLPPYTPSGSISSSGTVGITYSLLNVTGGVGGQPDVATTNGSAPHTNSFGLSISSSFSGTPQGGMSTPFGVVQPTILATTYLKL